jgi:hypothetical protein
MRGDALSGEGPGQDQGLEPVLKRAGSQEPRRSLPDGWMLILDPPISGLVIQVRLLPPI